MIFPAFMCYGLAMRSSTLIALVLAAAASGLLACGGDDPPVDERPDNGSVPLWGSCIYDQHSVPELCQPQLECQIWGLCEAPCKEDKDCPGADGVDAVCYYGSCRFPCDFDADKTKAFCPDTGVAETFCDGSLGPDDHLGWCSAIEFLDP